MSEKQDDKKIHRTINNTKNNSYSDSSHESDEDINSGFDLPENVTDEPQDIEHMHLVHLKGAPQSVVETYLRSSDDMGELLGDLDLEERMREICRYWFNVKDNQELVENPNSLFGEIHLLTKEYLRKFNMSATYTRGTLTKYGLRVGIALNFEKFLFQKMGKDWNEYFESQFNVPLREQVGRYMKIAEIPNVFRYHFFGIDKLDAISSGLQDNSEEDPVGSWLNKNKILFNPEMPETDLDMGYILDAVKIAANVGVLKKDGFEDKIEKLKELNAEMKKHLDNMDFIYESSYLNRFESETENINEKELHELHRQAAVLFNRAMANLLDSAKIFKHKKSFLDNLNGEDLKKLKDLIHEIEIYKSSAK